MVVRVVVVLVVVVVEVVVGGTVKVPSGAGEENCLTQSQQINTEKEPAPLLKSIEVIMHILPISACKCSNIKIYTFQKSHSEYLARNPAHSALPSLSDFNNLKLFF